MNETTFNELAEWVTEAGLIGRSETELMAGFCRRVVEAGVPLARALVILDTLHPIYEGRAFLWRSDTPETAEIREYGRTNEGEAAESWRRSVFFHLLQSGEKMLRRRLTAGDPVDFLSFKEARDEGMTDYLALIHRFADEGVIGEMDCVYSAWSSDAADGFDEAAVAALKRLAPFLKLALKSAALARVAGTLAETYLGRDPGRRVMSGRIVRGVAEKIGAVLWYSDLHGYTQISDNSPPEQIIPLLNDYAEVVISAVHRHGGDVLKLVGDGTLAIFTAGNRQEACLAALAAAAQVRKGKPEPGRPADHCGLSRAACRRRLLRQCWQQGSSGFHRHRPGRQRGQPHPGDEPFSRAGSAAVGELRRRARSRNAKPAGFGRPLRLARRRAAAGALHPRTRFLSRKLRAIRAQKLALCASAGLDEGAQYVVDARLVPLPRIAKPIQHVGIDPNVDMLLTRR